MAALAAAGLDTSRFTFFGFLPRSGAGRREVLDAVSTLPHTGVLFEAPGRVADTLGAIARGGGGERRCVVAREMTKKFEEFRRGTVDELAAYYADHPPRGEVVIVVSASAPIPVSEDELQQRVRAMRDEGLSARDVATRLADELGVPRNTVYRLAVKA
jgi:16S rRNA (cytidine1402-2'-O)-methyltransferase